jgi:K+-sensing histidine kinase KdpD
VYGDVNRIKQILYNLIGNAMKFTKHGSVTINCLIQARRLKVTVTDTGPGIDAAGQQLLFRKFQQTAQSIITRDDTRGTGLGLYISKLLIEHMGGQIRLEHSEVGKGSTFSFTMPFATPAQIKAGALVDTDSSSPAIAGPAAPAAARAYAKPKTPSVPAAKPKAKTTSARKTPGN